MGQDPLQILSIPGVKDLVTLAHWYRESLKVLCSLHRQGQLNAKQHLGSLRLRSLSWLRQEEEFRLRPLEPGRNPADSS